MECNFVTKIWQKDRKKNLVTKRIYFVWKWGYGVGEDKFYVLTLWA